MKTIEINNANIRINENCHIIDRGTVEIATVEIADNIEVSYAYVDTLSLEIIKQSRHIKIGKNAIFVGT